MAKPIEPTPVLKGNAAKQLLKEMAETEAKHNPVKEKYFETCRSVFTGIYFRK